MPYNTCLRHLQNTAVDTHQNNSEESSVTIFLHKIQYSTYSRLINNGNISIEKEIYNIIYDADLKYWSEPWFKKHYLSSSRNLVDISAVLLYIFTQAPIKRLCQMNIEILKKVIMMCYCKNFNE